MDKIRALIIDDEERAVNSLKSLLEQYVPEVDVIGYAHDVPEGVLMINELRPDLLFLDIEMPEYNGFELLKFFREIDFGVIFVTAYSEYALKAFEVSAVDYILKPVEVGVLRKGVLKFLEQRKISNNLERLSVLRENLEQNQFQRIALPVSEGLEFINVTDIIALEAEGAYTCVHLINRPRLLVSKKIKFFEELLDNRTLFYRPHRSYIINLNLIKKYLKGEGTIIMDQNLIISISRDKKAEFESTLRRLQIAR